MQDIVMLSSGSINGGIPFLPVEGSSPEGVVLALLGKFIRGQGSSYTFFLSWADYRRGAHGGLDLTFDVIKLRNTPAESMAAFNSL